MVETELKFQVPAAARGAVARAVATATAERVRLAASYVDTADRRLAAAGLALRLRREGRRWVQTLKGEGDGLLERPEHEVEVASAGRGTPPIDPARHAGTAVGERLRALLADGAALEEVYRTEIVRHRRVLRTGGAAVEIAHDRGRIVAGGRRLAVDELEFELKSGPAAALTELAGRWVRRHGLWWDVRTKSERGFRLAAGADTVPARRAGPSTLPAAAAGPAALARVLADALAQVQPNAAELVDGGGGAEHLHQLRVGLRRLRTALRDLAPWADDPGAALALEREWQPPFAALGALRDADVQGSGVQPVLAAAIARAGLPPLGAAAGVAPAGEVGATPTPTAGRPEVAALWCAPSLQLLLLRTLGLALAPARDPGAADRPFPAADELLRPLWRRVRRGQRELDTLDDPGLHRLRRQAKRLRYAVEALAPQLRPRRTRALLKALRRALEPLGELQDLHTAAQALADRAAAEPSAAFALGWIAARSDALRPPAAAALAEAVAAGAPRASARRRPRR